jgi:predicted ester cyclase
MIGPGYTYCEVGIDRGIDGLDNVIAGWRRWKAACPDLHGDVGHVHVEGDVTVAEVVWSATHTGAGPVPPTGKRVRIVDRVWTHWAGGLLVAEWHETGVLSLLDPLLRGSRWHRGCVASSEGRE